jgi:ABC-type polysaccharide/polyol phosphate export permease
VISATVSELVAMAVFLLIKWILTQNVSLYCILILGLIPLQVAFCFGLTLMVGTLNVFVRDISPLTTTFLFVWFFTSPIVFPLDIFPIQMKRLMWLNPMTSLTQLHRELLLYDRLPSLLPLALLLCFACLSLMIGYWIYRKTHKVIVDWV